MVPLVTLASCTPVVRVHCTRPDSNRGSTLLLRLTRGEVLRSTLVQHLEINQDVSTSGTALLLLLRTWSVRRPKLHTTHYAIRDDPSSLQPIPTRPQVILRHHSREDVTRLTPALDP